MTYPFLFLNKKSNKKESLKEASESAKTANILMNVSEFQSIDEATKSLIAMGAAYNDLSKMNIIDKLNEVGLKIA